MVELVDKAQLLIAKPRLLALAPTVNILLAKEDLPAAGSIQRAKQMQGQCLVESGPGYGTVIRLTLPLGPEAPAAPAR